MSGSQRGTGALQEEEPHLGLCIRARPVGDRMFGCDLKVEQELGNRERTFQAKEAAYALAHK